MNEMYIVPLELNHAPSLFEYLNEDNLYQYIPDKKFSTLAELETRFIRLINGSGRDDEIWLNWVIFKDKELKQPVGRLQVTIFPEQKTAQLGYVIFKPFWNLGYASKGVQWIENYLKQNEQFELDKLEAYVDPQNLASSKVLENNHFFLIRQEEDDLYYQKDLTNK